MCCDEECAVKWGRGFVVGVWCLILSIAYTSHVYLFWPWLSFHQHDRNLWLWLAPYHVLLLSIGINYVLGCTTSPGHPSRHYRPSSRDITLLKQSSGENKTISTSYTATKSRPLQPSQLRRWCKTCRVYKPPRTHHCSYCQRCVLRMDHHCPWLNTCIGHGNHAYFFRFIWSVALASSWGLALICLRIWDLRRYQMQYSLHHWQRYSSPSAKDFFYTPPPDLLEAIFMIYNSFAMIILLFSVGGLAIFQLSYAATNTTTIEQLENTRIAELQDRAIIPSDVEYPYDLGSFFRNMKVLLGPWWLLWPLPLPSPGNGIHFEARNDTPWPPMKYYEEKRASKGRHRVKPGKPARRRSPPKQLLDVGDSGSESDVSTLDDTTDSDVGFEVLSPDSLQSSKKSKNVGVAVSAGEEENDDDAVPLSRLKRRISSSH